MSDPTEALNVAVQAQLMTTNTYKYVTSDVYFDAVASDATMPYVAWFLVSGPVPQRCFSSDRDVQDATIQISVFDDRANVSDVLAVCSDIHSVFERADLTFPSGWAAKGCLLDGQTGPTWIGDCWQRTMDYRIRYAPSN